MMTNVTFSLPEKTVKRLKKKASEGGRRKGAISELVDDALTTYLDAQEASSKGELFTARKDDGVVAEATSLRALAAALKERKVDWRSVVISSSVPLDQEGHLGLRVRSA